MAYQKLQAYRAANVTPSDTASIPSVGGGSGTNNGCVLYVGVEGDLKVETSGGDVVTFKNMPVGYVPIQIVKIFATGTTANEIIALW
jgi:hypothetical protein